MSVELFEKNGRKKRLNY